MRTALVYAIFFLSGAAGLVYELVWMRQLVLVFGGTTYAVTTVVAVFMGGLGLGSWLGGRWSPRLGRPGQLYGLIELAVGLYALAVPVLFAAARPVYQALYATGDGFPLRLTLVRFVLSAAVLLVPTALMGATLPLLVRYQTRRGGSIGGSIGGLYGVNTLGAVLGVLGAGFWLIPSLGLAGTTRVAAVLNFILGITALVITRPAAGSQPADTRDAPESAADPVGAPPALTPRLRRALLAGFAISGFTAMAYQIAWTRALIMSLGSSSYSFTCILAAFILGLGLGSVVIARRIDRIGNLPLLFGAVELALGLAALLIIPAYGRLPLLIEHLVSRHADQYTLLVAVQFLLVIAITLAPTLLMGLAFPVVTRAITQQAREAGRATGRAYAVNTLGTIAGALLAGFVLIRGDVLGVRNAIVLAALLNGLVGVVLVLLASTGSAAAWKRRLPVALGAAALFPLVGTAIGSWDERVLTSAPFLNPGDIEEFIEARQVVYYGEGVDMTVAVVRLLDDPELISLSVNGKADASTDLEDMTTQLLIGHIPALVGPARGSACVIGLGSGMTLGALASYPFYERLDCIEISEEVFEAAAHFEPYNRQVVTGDPRVRMIRGDGRNHLLLSGERYDLIASQPSNPWMAGVSGLFTREFFQTCDAALTEGGCLAVWLHAYMMSVDDFRMVVRTLFEVFDSVSIWEMYECNYLLIAARQPPEIDWAELRRRFETPQARADLYRVGLCRPAHLLGRYVTSGQALRAWAASAPVHTDDNALLEFSAPRSVHAPQEREIAEGLRRLQRPVVGTVLADSAPLPAEVSQEVDRIVFARGSRARMEAALAREDTTGALAALVRGAQADPANVALMRLLLESIEILLARSPQMGQDSELPALLSELNELRQPLIAPRRGAGLRGIADLLEERAGQALARGHLAWAVADLAEAYGLDRSDQDTGVSLAGLLVQAGRYEEARGILDGLAAGGPSGGLADYLRAILAARRGELERAVGLLRAAVRAGAVTTAQLAADEYLGPLRSHPGFRELLDSTTPPQNASGSE